MRILVCLKQVPNSTKVEVDEKNGVLKRNGVSSKMNPYDLYALETALKIKDEHGGEVTVVTMGPPQAESVIREAYMMGADKGVLISDRRFAGADVLATSYTISQAIKAIGVPDLLICGKQTTDGDTAQVGPALAELLDLPHVAWVNVIKDITKDYMIVNQDMADSIETVQISFPCLITVEKGIYQPRLPSYKRKIETTRWPIKVMGMDDFPDHNENNYGLNGSPTQVERIFPPTSDVEQVIWEGDGTQLAALIGGKLRELKFI